MKNSKTTKKQSLDKSAITTKKSSLAHCKYCKAPKTWKSKIATLDLDCETYRTLYLKYFDHYFKIDEKYIELYDKYYFTITIAAIVTGGAVLFAIFK